MQKYLRLTKHLTQKFDKVEFLQIPRNQNMVGSRRGCEASIVGRRNGEHGLDDGSPEVSQHRGNLHIHNPEHR